MKKLLALFLIAFITLPSVASAALIVGDTSQQKDSAIGTSHTMAHTVVSGEQLFCFASSGTGTGSSFQFNGVAMSTVTTVSGFAGGTSYALYLENPDAGTLNFTWTSSANDNHGMTCISISGAKDTQPEASGTASGTNPTSPSATAVTESGLKVIWGTSIRNGAGSDQTINNGCSINQRLENYGGSYEAAMGYGTYSSSGSQSCDYTNGGTNNQGSIMLLVAEEPSSTSILAGSMSF